MRTRLTWVVTIVAALVLGPVAAPVAVADDPHVVTVSVTTDRGAPAPGIDVGLGLHDDSWDPGTTARTDAAGVARFTGVEPALYNAAVLTVGGTPAFYETVTVTDHDVAATIHLTGVQSVSGTVHDSRTGKPVGATTVTLAQRSAPGDPVSVASADGTFRFYVYAGTYTLGTMADDNFSGYVPSLYPGATTYDEAKPFTVTRGLDVTGVNLRIYRHATFAGKVTLGGKAIRAAAVYATLPATTSYVTTSSTGTYSFPTDPGKVSVYVDADRRNGWQRWFTTYLGNTVRRQDAASVTVGNGEALTGVDIALVRPALISGTVVDRKGKPAKHASVEAYALDRTGYTSTTTDSRGRYTLVGLASGKVRIYVSGGTEATPARGSRTVTATQGKTVKAAKIMLSNDAVVYGRVKTSGSSVRKQDVSLFDADGVLLGTFRPDDQGWVGFAAIPGGTYYVTVDGSNLRKKVVAKAHKETSFGTIKRGTQVTVKGVVRTAAGKPAKSVLVSVQDKYGTVYANVRTSSHGAYSVKAAVSGRYTIVARPKSGGDAWASVSVTVKKGKSLTKNLRLTKGAVITGTILNAKGKPAIGVRVETADGRSARTNKGGAYKLKGCHAGRTGVWISDPDYVAGYRNGYTEVTAKGGKTVKAPTARVR